MKKILLTCFLGGLCLFGSESMSQVVWSPGAGLVDMPLAPERAEEAAFPVAANHPGRESCTPPAQKGEEIVRLQLELPQESSPDTLWLTYWDKLLVDHAELTPGKTVPLTAEQGDFFAGNSSQKVYRWTGPSEKQFYISVRNKRNYLFQYWTWFPGDQLRMRVNPSTGQVLFHSPQSDFFEAQYELYRLSNQFSFIQVPLMVSSNPNRMLSDSLTSALYQRAMKNKSPISPSMQILTPGENEMNILADLVKNPLQEIDLIEFVSELGANLEENRKIWLKQRAWAYLGDHFFPRIKLGKRLFQDSEFVTALQKRLDEFYLAENSDVFDPLYGEQVSELIIIQARIQGKTLSELSAEYPQHFREFFWATYALSNFNKLEDKQGEIMELALGNSQSPWVRDLLSDRMNTALEGSKVAVESLLNWEGKPLDLKEFEGKTVLLSFWISGCKFCMNYYEKTLLPVYEELKDQGNIVFVSVNADPSSRYWKKNAETWRYSHPDMIQAHQDSGTGILETFRISSFPQKLLINSNFEVALLTGTQYSSEILIEKLLGISQEINQSESKTQ
ncbi:TlpA family protein disulfide reductase [Algoriphagus formosus]|uniref:Redoxin domain-containing protein n=1 Tax=Algoriphagus formosus TaxID=2007308 RepID=A0A4R5V9F9_9BACT|nr:thioredoxin-like domain-containing protein [Algoriphagus aquimaris]TDK48245.1 redoxin domain-containing protein [Algoriphagus aquimaris]